MDFSAIVPGVLLLGIVIFFHELGHFLMAKWRGVKVLRFSLGMGREMVGFTAGETRYSLSWVPLGGFVQMAGDHLNDDGSMPEGGPEQFLTHSWPGRLLIAIAGPLANLVLAYLTYVVLLSSGFKVPDFPNVLGDLAPATSAWQLGLRPGDHVIAVQGRSVRTWRGMEDVFADADTARGLSFTVERGERTIAVVLPAGRVRGSLRDLEPPSSPPVVGALRSGLPAYLGGVREGDVVLAVDGAPVARFADIPDRLAGKADRELVMRVRRDGRVLDLRIKPIPRGDGTNAAVIGIEPPAGLSTTMRLPIGEAIGSAATQTVASTGAVLGGLWMSITEFWRYHEQMGGPIFIAQMARDAARHGLDDWLALLAMINLAIMCFNLLPIPLLDGGHITLALLEGARHRAVSGRAYLNFQKVGLVFVGILFLFIISQDLLRPLRRQRALDKVPRETTTVAPGVH